MKDRVAIFDIGSNAVRLIVFDGAHRAPLRLRTERVLCRLGAGVAKTGRLDPAAKAEALAALRKFKKIVSSMKIRRLRAVATAALRDAADGKAFMKEAGRETGVPITIIGGREEARLSALGVMMNGLGADGVIGDYGGGSLELVATKGGKARQAASLSIGEHYLHALPTRAARIKSIDAALKKTNFLKNFGGGDFVALGGAWRALGKAHMAETGYPLPVLDQYAIPAREAAAFAARAARRPAHDQKAADVAVSALVLEHVLKRLKPERLVFSATGLREGLVVDMTPVAERVKDPLIASCLARLPERKRRAAEMRARKTALSFKEDVRRLVSAAALLIAACATAEEALEMPLYGADHATRAFLALALGNGKPHALRKIAGKKMTALAGRMRKIQRDA